MKFYLTKPPIRALAEREMQEAERDLFAAQKALEGWQAEVAKLENRIERLRAYLETAP